MAEIKNQAVELFLDMKNQLLADRAKDRAAVIDGVIAIWTAAAALKTAGQEVPQQSIDLAVNGILADLGTAGYLRVRDTWLTDIKITKEQNINIEVIANPVIPASFGFGMVSGTSQRTVSETEIDGQLAFPISEFTAQLIEVGKGSDAIAILQVLKDLIGVPQV